MLDVFYGGLLFHPAALDYSDETCSHGCAYCFANINKAYREGDLAGAIRKLWKQDDTTLTGWLLRQGYPICVSNRTDAFARNNVRNTRALFQHLAERDNGIFIQTKGGDGIGEIIESLPRKPVIYLSITMADDDLAKTVEPAAPLPSERLALARHFIERGFVVIAAINPCSKTWLPPDHFPVLMERIRAAGVGHVVIEMLDMGPARMRKIGEARKARLGQAPATLGREDRAYVRECTGQLVDAGFHVAKKGMPWRSEFYTAVEGALGRTMPSLQTFINRAIDNRAERLTFDEFAAWFGVYVDLDVPVRGNALRGYLLRNGFETWKTHQRVDTFRELVRIAWNDPKTHVGVQNHFRIAPVLEGGVPLRDADGNAVLMFNQPTEGR